MSGTSLFVLITVGAHCIGVPVMIWAVRGEDGLRGLRDWFPDEDGSDGGGGGSALPPAPDGGSPAGGLPLPVSEQPRKRLREHGDRVADPGRAPSRRRRTPAEPDRTPVGPRR